MSHFKERKEKICLNCGTEVQGKYCHNCGQENVEPKETFWHLVTHFFNDITHFDGKIFATLKYLLFKPGFLSKEYMKGRRASYLNPIRMYVFTSAIFFLIFFSIFKPEESLNIKTSAKGSASVLTELIKSAREGVQDEIKETKDSADKIEKNKILTAFEHDLLRLQKDSTISRDSLESAQYLFKNNTGFVFKEKYKTLNEYDSVQNVLPDDKKDSGIEQLLTRKGFEWKEKYGDIKSVLKVITEKFFHSIPQMLFISLPFFALFLKLLYIRRRQFYYADHGIFSIHLYCTIFILLLIIFGFNKLGELLHWGWIGTVNGFVIFSIFVYVFLTMKRFYGQGYFKTFIKYFFLLFLNIILFSILMVTFFILSFVRV